MKEGTASPQMKNKHQASELRSTPTSQAMEFGTAYYPDHWPEPDWSRDLDRMKACGIDVVRFGEFSWSWLEPSQGKFQRSAYDRYVKLCQQRDIRLILCTPTATLPPWLLKQHPDCRLVDADGHPCTSHRHFWCWNHRPSRAIAENTIRQLARHFRGHPSVQAWQIDNEPNYAEQVTIYDFNPYAIADFRAWLRVKYDDTLDALNRAWYTNFWSQRYGQWDEIGVYVPQRCNPNYWLDFARFRDLNLAEMIRWQVGLIQEEDPSAKVGTNIPEVGCRMSFFVGQDVFEQARQLDWVGTDLYAASGDRSADLRSLGYSCDLMRSASGKAKFIIAETQAGPHQRTWPQSFSPECWKTDYLRDSVRTYVEHGAKAVYFFLFRPTPGGQEMGMNGLTAPDGGESDRTRMVRNLADRKPDLLARQSRRLGRPLAVIHYSRDSIRFLGYWQDSLPLLDASYQGWHRLLDEAGYRVDFVDDEGFKAGLPKETELFVLPQTHVADDAIIAGAIRAANRMPVIVGPHTALLDEHGLLRQQCPGGQLAARASVIPGYWHDVKICASVAGIKLAPIPGYRQIDMSGKKTSGKVLARFALPGKPTAMVKAKNVLWCAFDVGSVYAQSTARGKAWLRRTLLLPT